MHQPHHPFSPQSKSIAQGSTYNLMDYTAKTPNTTLRKYQWYVIHNPRLSLFGCSEEEVSDVYTQGSFVEEFLTQIREANLKHDHVLKIDWKYSKMGFIDENVQIYENLGFKVAVGVNGTDIKSIKPLMAESDVKMHNDITFKDVLIYAINMFGDFFDVEEYSGAYKVRTFRFHEPNTARYIFVTCEEKYSNILGNYLFGKDWNFQHLENDRNWVLHLHSPWFSEKFNTAKGNLIEQRRLIYLALGQSTADADEKVLKQFKYIAKLTSNVSAKKEGLTIYTYKWNSKGDNIVPNPTPLQYEPYNNVEWPDVKYPVDIKLWDGNDKPALGGNFYSEYQFRKGKFTDVSFGASVVVPGGSGLLKGYIKGFGYCEFAYLNHTGKAISVDAGLEFSTGIVEGKYIKTSGIPNPVSFSGPGSNKTYSTSDFKVPVGPTLAYWIGYDNEGTPTWKGSSVGIKAELSIPLFKKLNLPGGYTETKVYTELIYPLLDKKSETYTRLNDDKIYNGKK